MSFSDSAQPDTHSAAPMLNVELTHIMVGSVQRTQYDVDAKKCYRIKSLDAICLRCEQSVVARIPSCLHVIYFSFEIFLIFVCIDQHQRRCEQTDEHFYKYTERFCAKIKSKIISSVLCTYLPESVCNRSYYKSSFFARCSRQCPN